MKGITHLEVILEVFVRVERGWRAVIHARRMREEEVSNDNVARPTSNVEVEITAAVTTEFNFACSDRVPIRLGP